MNKKKKYGQFFTSPIIAEFMTKLTIDDHTKNFLDPAVGPGIFVEYANKINNKMDIDAYEIDKEIIKEYEKKINFKTNVINADYLYSDLKKYDCIVCNPPYNKFQEIDDRDRLKKMFEQEFHIKLSGHSNYCMYFLIKCLNSLSKNGRCAFIIPYEFMNASYGDSIKKYILENKMLKLLIKFNNDLKLFDDAMTTSCILYFENKKHDFITFVELSDVNEVNNIFDEKKMNEKSYCYNYADLKYNEKWSKYFQKKKNQYRNLIEFKKMAQVKRGIATGNNKYFTLSIEDIRKNLLSDNVCVSCVSKSQDINELVMTYEYFTKLVKENKKMYLFDGRKKTTDNDDKYIKYGEKINVHKTYLNSHRNPWYSIENIKPAPIWISVFSRNKLKVIRNEILINNLTTFHGIYINKEYEKYTDILFCYLQTPIAQKILRMNKREYGEGLDKFEPNDINNAYILDLSVISDKDLNIIKNIYDNYKKEKQMDIDLLNKIFAKYIEDK